MRVVQVEFSKGVSFQCKNNKIKLIKIWWWRWWLESLQTIYMYAECKPLPTEVAVEVLRVMWWWWWIWWRKIIGLIRIFWRSTSFLWRRRRIRWENGLWIKILFVSLFLPRTTSRSRFFCTAHSEFLILLGWTEKADDGVNFFSSLKRQIWRDRSNAPKIILTSVMKQKCLFPEVTVQKVRWSGARTQRSQVKLS